MHRGHRYSPKLLIVAKPDLYDCQIHILGEKLRYILLFIICRVEEEVKEPTSENTVSTFDAPAVLMGVCK
jgi:hypothetical protein